MVIAGDHPARTKGEPIWLASIHSKADCLLTGDFIEHLYGKRIARCRVAAAAAGSSAGNGLESAGLALLFR